MPRTPKNDREGYLFIVNSFLQIGKQPSLQAICDALEYRSKRSAQLMLKRLARAGRIGYKDGKIELVQDALSSGGENTVSVPVVGSASCGALDFAEENIDEYLNVSTVLARPGYKYFILRAKGESMNLSGINNGDLVLVRKQVTANEGEKVVALVNDEASIKHFHREQDFVVLRPNSTDRSIKPIILSEEFSIQGVVITRLPNPY
jgi:repressor LexA